MKPAELRSAPNTSPNLMPILRSRSKDKAIYSSSSLRMKQAGKFGKTPDRLDRTQGEAIHSLRRSGLSQIILAASDLSSAPNRRILRHGEVDRGGPLAYDFPVLEWL